MKYIYAIIIFLVAFIISLPACIEDKYELADDSLSVNKEYSTGIIWNTVIIDDNAYGIGRAFGKYYLVKIDSSGNMYKIRQLSNYFTGVFDLQNLKRMQIRKTNDKVVLYLESSTFNFDIDTFKTVILDTTGNIIANISTKPEVDDKTTIKYIGNLATDDTLYVVYYLTRTYLISDDTEDYITLDSSGYVLARYSYDNVRKPVIDTITYGPNNEYDNIIHYSKTKNNLYLYRLAYSDDFTQEFLMQDNINVTNLTIETSNILSSPSFYIVKDFFLNDEKVLFLVYDYIDDALSYRLYNYNTKTFEWTRTFSKIETLNIVNSYNTADNEIVISGFYGPNVWDFKFSDLPDMKAALTIMKFNEDSLQWSIQVPNESMIAMGIMRTPVGYNHICYKKIFSTVESTYIFKTDYDGNIIK